MINKVRLQKITRGEIKDSILRSGYLIEKTVGEMISQHGYFVAPNPTYLDPITGKTREIDIQADSDLMEPDTVLEGITWNIYCECENNQQPVVFFPYEPLFSHELSENIKCCGLPMKIWVNGKYMDIFSFLRFHRFHHYCKGNVATQYCSFVQDKKEKKWVATHLEEQHDTFNSLVLSIENTLSDFYHVWEPPEQGETEPIFIQCIYPLIVLGGDLMEARLDRKGLKVSRTKHVQFIKTMYLDRKPVDYQIDVVAQDYIEQYLSIIDVEMAKLNRLIKRHKRTLLNSISHILEDVKQLQKPVDSYRKVLTS